MVGLGFVHKLPPKFFGISTDEILGYTTTRRIWIRDREIGIVYYLLILVVLFWVIGVQILWRNEHFLRKDVMGTTRMLYSHPTLLGCDANLATCESDYIPLDQLPYCDVFKGEHWTSAGPCKYADMVTAVPGGEVDNKLFFPTTVETLTQTLIDGEYKAEPGSDCLQAPSREERGDSDKDVEDGYMCSTRGNRSGQFYYVGDIKSYTLQLTSGYDRAGEIGTSLEHGGYYEVCEANMRGKNETRLWVQRLKPKAGCEAEAFFGAAAQRIEIPCQPGLKCAHLQEFNVFEHTGLRRGFETIKEGPDLFKKQPQLEKSEESQDFLQTFQPPLDHDHHGRRKKFVQHRKSNFGHAPGTKKKGRAAVHRGLDQYVSKWGDTFRLGRILELAGVDIDNDYNIDGWSARQSGAAIEILCVYENLYPVLSTFGYKPVRYTYRVKELPMPFMSRTQLAAEQPQDYPQTRHYEVRHGILVTFKVAGTFGEFNMTYLLVMLTTAFALIAAATTITDVWATYVHPKQNNFFHLKYEVSPDFSACWKCPKCAYENHPMHATCTGVAAWNCPEDQKACGCPAPDGMHIPRSPRSVSGTHTPRSDDASFPAAPEAAPTAAPTAEEQPPVASC